MKSIREALGSDAQIGSGTFTPPVGKKIGAIGVHAAANITNYKHTPKNYGGTAQTQQTVSTKGWMGSVIDPTGASSFIPLDHPADEITISAGTIFVYFIKA